MGRLGIVLLVAGMGWGQEIGRPPVAPQDGWVAVAPKRVGEAGAGAANWIDTSSRAVVQASYLGSYVPNSLAGIGWTGDLTVGNAGTTAAFYKVAVAARLNWLRGLAGIASNVSLSDVYNQPDQFAAMMMAVNGQLSHNPPSNWKFYSADGARAASQSNLCLGFDATDPGCLELYMQDHGASNSEAGHRRWILYPQTTTMGTGDVPDTGTYLSANALWVIDSATYGGTRPATRDGFVAWPPKGYVPYELVYPRWSLSYPGADFSVATVSMSRGGSAVPVKIETGAVGYGENTIVWVIDNLDASQFIIPKAPASDTAVTVTVGNVLVNGSATSFSYTVTIFDPYGAAPGATYQFNPPSATVSSLGGTGSTSLIVSPSTTGWAGVSDSGWLTLPNGASGTGTSAVFYSAAASTTSFPRSGTITAGGAKFTVTQPGAACSYSLTVSGTSFPAAGGSGTIVVTPNPLDCVFNLSWDSWIQATFSGSTLSYTLGANQAMAGRTGHITVGNQSVTISQAGTAAPTYSIGGTVTRAGSTAGVAGVSLVLTGGASTVTNGAGGYSFSGLAGGGSYRVTPVAAGYVFSPTSMTFDSLAASQTANFRAIDSRTFVTSLYSDLLSRVPDAGGLNFWSSNIDNGTFGRSFVGLQFFNSPEFVSTGLYLIKLYVAILGRDPDFGGWSYWFSAYRAGLPLSTVLSSFLSGPEFQSTYGALSNSQFVNLVYQNVLGRAPDSGGQAYWVGLLNTNQLSRGDVMNSFVMGTEFDGLVRPRAYANLLYMGFLRRNGDASGLQYWTGILEDSSELGAAVNGFLSGPEYLSRF